jgi:hypothetical protein
LARPTFLKIRPNRRSSVMQLHAQAPYYWSAFLETNAQLSDVAGKSKRSIAEVVLVDHARAFCRTRACAEGSFLYCSFLFRFSLMNDLRLALRSMLKAPP